MIDLVSCTDYGYPMRVFRICIPNILADWADQPNKALGILGFFGSVIFSDFVTVYTLGHDFALLSQKQKFS